MSRSSSPSPASGLRPPAHPAVRTLALACVAAIAVTGCARGSTNDKNNDPGIEFSSDAELQGKLDVMGFNRDADEVASTRTDLAEEAIKPLREAETIAAAALHRATAQGEDTAVARVVDLETAVDVLGGKIEFE